MGGADSRLDTTYDAPETPDAAATNKKGRLTAALLFNGNAAQL
jgi:hypothetical protein